MHSVSPGGRTFPATCSTMTNGVLERLVVELGFRGKDPPLSGLVHPFCRFDCLSSRERVHRGGRSVQGYLSRRRCCWSTRILSRMCEITPNSAFHFFVLVVSGTFFEELLKICENFWKILPRDMVGGGSGAFGRIWTSDCGRNLRRPLKNFP